MENSINWIPILVTALIPMIIGSIYYGPVAGKAWMGSLGYTEEDLKGANMAIIFGVSLVLSFFLAAGIDLTIELTHKDVLDGVLIYGSHHTFGHGALHGFFLGLLFGIPVLVNNSLFQRNSGKNILINLVYWLLTFAIMGGVLDAWN